MLAKRKWYFLNPLRGFKSIVSCLLGVNVNNAGTLKIYSEVIFIAILRDLVHSL